MRIDEPTPGTRRTPLDPLWRLTKPRIGLWVLIATACGFAMARGGAVAWDRLFAALLGTALVTCGAAVMNQLFEHRQDRMMARTQGRPLPSRSISPRDALIFGATLAASGMAVLIGWTTGCAALLAAAAFAIYLVAYTPLKQRSAACVAVGAIAGALPPAIGWAANGGAFNGRSGLLFGLLFLWQMPHLLAIVWLHRGEYAAAGFAFWGQRDERGRPTAVMAFCFTLALAAVAQNLAIDYHAARPGGLAILLLNGALAGCAFWFWLRPSCESARRLFVATLIYLPLVLGTLVFLARLEEKY